MPSDRKSLLGDLGRGSAPRRAATSTSRSRGVRGETPWASVSAAKDGSTTRSPGGDPADGVGKLFGRGVLDDEPERARLHGPAQVTGAAEGGEDERAALGHLLGEDGGGRQAVDARHLDVEQGDVRMMGLGRGHDLVAPADRGDDLEVVFERRAARPARCG